MPGSIGPKDNADAKEAFREFKGVAQKSSRSIALYFHSQRKNIGGFCDRFFFFFFTMLENISQNEVLAQKPQLWNKSTK